ncbi:porin [Curvibacter sp. HBC61]|uniref:Porin n=1 Tax=Curvibacter cyanobacteriorum TaxID=3026422 RepID=A0ABT5MUI3_9BURK|nr:porin [Curvibacter sp. HBC61]MDD0837685.1 porin [Curvibacter sp. HBC61]
MKKIALPLALCGLALNAAAQSSVTLYGVLDTTVQHATQGGNSITRMFGTGGNQYSRLGIRGTEDLGGGLSAGFVLDAGLNVASGTGGALSADNATPGTVGGLVFNRRASLSLISRQWGELRLGRGFVPSYWNLIAFDPFGTAGAGGITNIAQSALTRVSTVQTAVRASNSVGYHLPELNGVYGELMAAVNNAPSNAATPDNGNYQGARVGYTRGDLNVAVATGRTAMANGAVSTSNLGGSYKVGAVTGSALYFTDSKNAVAGPNRSNGWMLGAKVKLGSGYIPLSYAKVTDNSATARSAHQLAIGYVHDLSKRTAVYTTYSQIRNRNGAALSGGGVTGVANATWTGMDFGIRHSF